MSNAALDKLDALRKAMMVSTLDAFVLPVNDETLGEYPSANGRRLEWLSGFTGSAGMAVVLKNRAALFVDGRYTLQAEQEVGKEFERLNSGEVKLEEWLATATPAGARIGYDPKLHTSGFVERLKRGVKGRELVPVERNLIDLLWEKRPSAPMSMVVAHSVEVSGEDSPSKRDRIAAELQKRQLKAAVIAVPDSVNWLLNIRGADLEHTPLAIATAILFDDAHLVLFLDESRCSPGLKQHLTEEVTLADPASLPERLAALKGQRVLVDAQSAAVWFKQVLEQAGAQVVEEEDPCLLPKAAKNDIQLKGIRKAHLRDGVAVVKLLTWLDSHQDADELTIAARLEAFRAEEAVFISPSFATIAGSGPNGAIVHYRATEKSNRKLIPGELLLLDSGGQYPDGTTDITRTVAIGEPTAEMKSRFTLVLKGHIALANACFPKGTSGSQLDALARQFVWQAGLDYDHGTGHGVGQCLNVHEGPQRISKRGGDAALVPGMILSNEPGYYKPGEYGIRIENLVAVVEKRQGEGKPYYGFETLTCVPIDQKLIDRSLLTEAECDWLNAYHGWVLAALSPKLGAAERAWLEKACVPISLG